jgi:enoyl-CoA hydratase
MADTAHKIDVRRDRRGAGFVAHLVFDHSRRLNVLNPSALHDLT